MKATITLVLGEKERRAVLEQLSKLYDKAYPHIKDWLDSEEAKQVKREYWALTALITELNLWRVSE